MRDAIQKRRSRFVSAGDGAAAVYANREAIAHYEAALALGHPEVVALHAAIGALRTRLGDYGGAIASLEAAVALAAPAEQASLELALARAQIRRGDLVAADRHLDAGLAVTGDGAIRSKLLVHRAVIRRRAADLLGAEWAAGDALAAATAASDPATTGSAHRMIGLLALDQGDPIAARASLELAVVAAAADPDPTARIAALVGLALAESALGDADGDARPRTGRRVRLPGASGIGISRRPSRTTSPICCTRQGATKRHGHINAGRSRRLPRSAATRPIPIPGSGCSPPGESLVRPLACAAREVASRIAPRYRPDH